MGGSAGRRGAGGERRAAGGFGMAGGKNQGGCNRVLGVQAELDGERDAAQAAQLEAQQADGARGQAAAADLAADLRRHLTDEPITARPPSAGYQLQKFARRHTAIVVGVAAVFAALVAGTAVSTWQAIRARRAEAAAQRRLRHPR